MSEVKAALETTAKGAAILFIGYLISKVLTYGFRLVVARLGTEAYGLISLAIVILVLLGNIAMLGTHMGVHRYAAFYNARKEEAKVKGTLLSATYVSLALSVVFTVVIFFSANSISEFIFNDSSLAHILKILILGLPFFAIANLFMYALQAFNRSDYTTYGKYIGESVTRVLFTVIAIYLGYQIAGVAYAYVLSLILTAVTLFYLLNTRTFHILSKVKAKYNFRELVRFSWPLVLSTIFWMLMSQIDTLMIGYYMLASDVGIYNAAAPTSQLLLVIPVTFSLIFLPIITQLYSKKKYSELKQASKIIFKWNLFLSLPILLLFILFSETILRILFGADYVLGATSLVALGAGYFIYGFLLFNTELLKLVKKSKLIIAITAASILLNFVLNVFLIQSHGIFGASIATAIAFLIYSILTLAIVLKKTRINLIDKYSGKIFASGIIAFLLVYVVNSMNIFLGIVSKVILAMAFALIYIVLIFLMRGFVKEDLTILNAIQKKTGLNLSFLEKLVR